MGDNTALVKPPGQPDTRAVQKPLSRGESAGDLDQNRGVFGRVRRKGKSVHFPELTMSEIIMDFGAESTCLRYSPVPQLGFTKNTFGLFHSSHHAVARSSSSLVQLHMKNVRADTWRHLTAQVLPPILFSQCRTSAS